MRDRHDNVVVVCSIENLDPMGVHTGDSITVAPAMTLTDREYQHMRDVGHRGAARGRRGHRRLQHPVRGAPGDRPAGRDRDEPAGVPVVSALASKATGFPIAKIAARLAIGYTLDEIRNDITGETPAAFEPTLDYVVVKIPRFAFEKFPGADPELTTTMKSVGEAMALGRSFPEALGKALRSMETAAGRLLDHAGPGRRAGQSRTPDRRPDLRASSGRCAAGASVAEVAAATRASTRGSSTRSTRWSRCARRSSTPPVLDARAAAPGQAGRAVGPAAGRAAPGVRRRGRGAHAAAPARASARSTRPSTPAPPSSPRARPYHYSAYETDPGGRVGDRAADRAAEGAHPRLRAEPDRAGHRVRLLVRARGDGAARRRGLRDRDGQLQPGDGLHRLRHRRPALLRAAHVRGRARGGARRAGLRHGRRGDRAARRADPARAGRTGSPRPGCRWSAPARRPSTWPSTAASSARCCARRACRRPRSARRCPSTRPARSPTGSATRCWCARPTCSAGAAWRSSTTSRRWPATSPGRPRSARSARCWSTGSSTTPIEIDVDALCDGDEVFLGGVMEHIEEAGVHSGDSSCALPPITPGPRRAGRGAPLHRGHRARGRRARAAQRAVRAARRDALRAGGQPAGVAHGAVRVQGDRGAAGQGGGADHARRHRSRELRAEGLLPAEGDGGELPPDAPIAVKEAVLPFHRFRTREGQGVDPLLGPEMKSTGEVMGFDASFGAAFAKSQAAAYGSLPTVGPGVRVDRRPGQAGDGVPGAAAGRPRLRGAGHRGHRGRAAPARDRRHGGAQALRGAEARRSSTGSWPATST